MFMRSYTLHSLFFQRGPPRTGWPTEASMSAQTPKANVILQAQLKQLEALSEQNKVIFRTIRRLGPTV